MYLTAFVASARRLEILRMFSSLGRGRQLPGDVASIGAIEVPEPSEATGLPDDRGRADRTRDRLGCDPSLIPTSGRAISLARMIPGRQEFLAARRAWFRLASLAGFVGAGDRAEERLAIGPPSE
jgi:hypothetical protein